MGFIGSYKNIKLTEIKLAEFGLTDYKDQTAGFPHSFFLVVQLKASALMH